MTAKRKILLSTSIIASMVAIAAPSFAQSAQQLGRDESQVDEVIVTGSRIRRDPTTAPTPLIQVSREQLQSTGLSTVIDYLATIPALANSQVPSDTVGNLNSSGLSLPNLRSLGAGRTLTLVDGRRHVGSAGGSLAVDIDTIPRLLIENIEIITGGASSVYGADAVSGVLNFVLRKDFDGVEIDANIGESNQGGPYRGRVSALAGKNFFDDRLNLYAFAEYENIEEIKSTDIDWINDANVLLGVDADPTATPFDGEVDNRLFSGVVRLDRPRWGSLTLANNQQPTSSSDPDITYPSPSCTGISQLANSACYSVDPTKTYWFDGTTARLANFGQRVGATGANRPFNIGGDGESPGEFANVSRTPKSESQRYQVGANFRVTDNINASLEAKYITEDSFLTSQPTFFDVYLSDSQAATVNGRVRGTASFDLRVSDNAYLPANVKAAILGNTVQNYSLPTATSPGLPTTVVAAPFAVQRMFGPDRTQTNQRELQRYVASLSGDYDQVGFIRNLAWDFSYTFGQSDNVNNERGVDVIRFAFAADAVVDTAGIVNGRQGETVCRVQLLAKQNLPITNYNPSDSRATFAATDPEVTQCRPLNIFGKGNQSAEGLSYVDASINVRERNQQQDAVFSVSGQLWDFWGAGPIGVAFGGEYREEKTRAIGRSTDTAGRFLFLNTGPDFPEVSYDTTEYFAEVSLPLFRDSFLGKYAELSGSYRNSDYSTVGKQDVYGVNLVYRPVQELAFKTSYNTSIRVPSLSENFRPYTQTFANGFVDPCATVQITNANLAADIRANRIANCTALAAQQGFSFDFAGSTATTADDFQPIYTSGVAGVNGGNPFLQPEESTSFTFSSVYSPQFIPNLTLVLDYYEIEISNVIASVTAQTAANNCVSGPSLNSAACATIFRRTGNPATPFYFGAPAGDPIGGFIQGSVNYAQRTTRGLDFTARYAFNTEEMIGRNWGTFNYSINGSWLIEQQDFLDAANPANFTESASTVFFPRVRFTSTLTWHPTEVLQFSWVADFQTAQNILFLRDFVANADSRPLEYLNTGNFVRNDFNVRYDLNNGVTLRAGVTNAFDAEQAPWLGVTLDSQFDPYGRRFNMGLNYRF